MKYENIFALNNTANEKYRLSTAIWTYMSIYRLRHRTYEVGDADSNTECMRTTTMALYVLYEPIRSIEWECSTHTHTNKHNDNRQMNIEPVGITCEHNSNQLLRVNNGTKDSLEWNGRRTMPTTSTSAIWVVKLGMHWSNYQEPKIACQLTEPKEIVVSLSFIAFLLTFVCFTRLYNTSHAVIRTMLSTRWKMSRVTQYSMWTV